MTSYKTLWQEANSENERLRADNRRLREKHRQEMDRVYALLTSKRSEDFDCTPQLVDLAGIARHMKVARFTPQQWAQRGLLPPPDFPELSEPVWLASTIKYGFAADTGRQWYDTLPEGEAEGLSPAA